jgi:hypothetical protein
MPQHVVQLLRIFQNINILNFPVLLCHRFTSGCCKRSGAFPVNQYFFRHDGFLFYGQIADKKPGFNDTQTYQRPVSMSMISV